MKKSIKLTEESIYKSSIDVLQKVKNDAGSYNPRTSFINVFSKNDLQIGYRKVTKFTHNTQYIFVKKEEHQDVMKKSSIHYHQRIWGYLIESFIQKCLSSCKVLWLMFDLSTKNGIKYLDGAHYYSRKIRPMEKIEFSKKVVSLTKSRNEKYNKYKFLKSQNPESTKEIDRLILQIQGLDCNIHFLQKCINSGVKVGRFVFMKEIVEASVTGDVVRREIQKICDKFKNKIACVLDKGPKVTKAGKDLFKESFGSEYFPVFGCFSHTLQFHM